MIPKYYEKSQEVEIHGSKHTPAEFLEDGWEAYEECRCETVVTIQAAYAWNTRNDHEIILRVNGGYAVVQPDVARAIASALCFAANDAEQLNRDFPTD